MKKALRIMCAILMVCVGAAHSADQIIQHTERMVGAGHPTLADTLNRGFLIQHNAEGVHTIVPWAAVTDTPTTIAGYGITDAMVSDNVAVTGGSIINVTLQGVSSSYYDPISSIQGQLSGKQAGSATLSDVSDGRVTNPLVFNDDVYFKFGTDNDFRVYYKAADSTLVIALDNGDAVCSFSKTGIMACTGEIVATQYSTTATDNQFFVQVANSGTPPIPAIDNAGMIWFSTADNTLKVTNSDGAVGSITVTFP